MQKNTTTKYRRKSKLAKAVGIILTLLLIIVLTIGISCVIFGIWMIKNIDTSIDSILISADNTSKQSRLYTVDENGVYAEYAGQTLSDGSIRDNADYDELPENLKNAFIAIEDKRFYKHSGVDILTSAKAVLKYIIPSSKRSPGGSTITQQLVKNLTGDDDYSVKRKVQEMTRAINLERVLTKNEILTLYLNNIYLSQNIYGVKPAAKVYFNKDVSQLSLIECAAIAAITQAPTRWDPIVNPENNSKRRDVVLSEMYSQGLISEEEYRSAYGKELLLDINKEAYGSKITSWYTDAVIYEASELIAEKYDISNSAASEMLFKGGYSIVIAMDPEIQSTIEKYYNEKRFEDAQSSFVVIDPETGHILGLAGGMGEKEGSRVLNRAYKTQRSPGSVIKPVAVYAPALEEGIINYASVYDDIPYIYGNGEYDSLWPHNVTDVYKGLCNIEYAVKHSVNTVAVRVLSDLDIGYSYDFLKNKLGISTLTDGETVNGRYFSDVSLSLALGGLTNGVTLSEMTAAYSIFPNEGVFTEAVCVLKIYDNNGILISDNTPKSERVLSVENAQIMTKLLQTVLEDKGATAYSHANKILALTEAAGKTGTTTSNNDKWFIGYTPSLIGGIWMGYDQPKSLSGLGASAHIDLWDEIMSEITELKGNTNGNRFNDDRLIEASYCIDSGKIVTAACGADLRGSRVDIGYFAKDDLPNEYCDRHTLVRYCTQGEGIASNSCPDEVCIYVGLIKYKRSMPYNINTLDAEYLYIKPGINDKMYYHRSLPYYYLMIKPGAYPGRSTSEAPRNRFCTVHTSLK